MLTFSQRMLLTPGSVPFALAPGVLQFQKTLSINLDRLLDRVGVGLNDALSLAPAIAPNTSTAAKEELFIDLKKFFPKLILQ